MSDRARRLPTRTRAARFDLGQHVDLLIVVEPRRRSQQRRVATSPRRRHRSWRHWTKSPIPSIVLATTLLHWLRGCARETRWVIDGRSSLSAAPPGYRFPREVIAVAVRWYLRYGLSYRDVEELLAERGVDVDHLTVYRWVQTFTRSSSRQPAQPVTLRVTCGSSTKPTSRSPDAGPICTGRLISTVR